MSDADETTPPSPETLVERLVTLLTPEDVSAAIAAGERLGQAIPHVAASESGRWRLFDTFNPRNATQAFTELEWE